MTAYLTAEYAWMAWTLLAVVCMILEVTSGDFFLTCFAIGALAAIVPAALVLPLWLQILVWVAVSVLSIYFIRPFILQHLHSKEEDRKSNADALIGRTGRVVQPIPAGGHGYVQIDGDTWKSCSTTGEAIPEGSRVVVVQRESIILTVKRQQQP